jgi:hypothetical protein
MVLTDPEIRSSLRQIKEAFPSFSDWDYNNEDNRGAASGTDHRQNVARCYLPRVISEFA